MASIPELSVRRPVAATVVNLLLVLFGLVAFLKLPLAEYPDVGAPVISISTVYRGASASIIETRITKVIEDSVSGVEGVRSISSTSREGISRVSVEFEPGRDLDAAVSDLRDGVARSARALPEDSLAPQISRSGEMTSSILRLNFFSEELDRLELTDFVERRLVDEFSVIDGVAEVEVSGARQPAVRVWLDPAAMAARGLTVAGIEAELQDQTRLYPAGRIELENRELAVEVSQQFTSVEDFRNLVLGQGSDGQLVRLGEVARVELGAEDERNENRSNQQPSVGIGISKQTLANGLQVARHVKEKVLALQAGLPPGAQLVVTLDDSLFIEEAIDEVYLTLLMSLALVVGVIYLFLGAWRAVLIPAVTVPVALISTFTVLYLVGYSVNLISLLAVVLAIGLVVDDSIVVLENVQRRIRAGETPVVAAERGSRQVIFAVISTTVVVVGAFLPIMFIEGEIGRLFSELAVTVAAAVAISGFTALTLTPAMCGNLLRANVPSGLRGSFDAGLERLRGAYRRSLEAALGNPRWAVGAFVCLVVASVALGWGLRREYVPKEDRGMFFIFVQAPEGASLAYTDQAIRELEATLMPLVESGEAIRVGSRIPGWGGSTGVQTGVLMVSMAHWDTRARTTQEIVEALRPEIRRVAALAGVSAVPVLPGGGGASGTGGEVEVVIGGNDHEELGRWSELLIEMAEGNRGLRNVTSDYRADQPQLRVLIDEDRAGALGVPISSIGATLETLLNGRTVTSIPSGDEQYDVIVQGDIASRQAVAVLEGFYIESRTTGMLVPLGNIATRDEVAGTAVRNRYNRMPAVTISANLAPGYPLGDAVRYFEDLVRSELPPSAVIGYRGETLKFKESDRFAYGAFVFALVVIFLVLAAQFESVVDPAVIMLTVPLAVFGGVLGLALAGDSLNLYSQIGIVMLVGIAAKNGILLVEFANQLLAEGVEFRKAIVEASCVRLRPILMTGLSTALGAVPLVVATGAGANSRFSLGVVIFSGVLFATLLTLFVVPVFYQMLGRLRRRYATMGA